MLRRNNRLRREYLYRQALKPAERAEFERKRRVKEALAEGKAMPADLKDDAHALLRDAALDDEATAAAAAAAAATDALDDEYALAGVREPKVLITTCIDPSQRLIRFVKELKLVIPNAERFNRGHASAVQMADACRTNHVTDLLVVHENRGVPDALIVSHMPFGPTAYFTLSNVVTRADVDVREPMPEAAPHIVLDALSSALGRRVGTILKCLFPVPKVDSRRVVTFANRDDYISFRNHVYERRGDSAHVRLKELGPRFDMRLYQLRLGTIEQTFAQSEFSLRPFIRTGKKRRYLSV